MKVFAQVIGGEVKEYNLTENSDGDVTVADLKKAEPKFANYQAAINGTPADDSDLLEEYNVVTLSEKVKGATR